MRYTVSHALEPLPNPARQEKQFAKFLLDFSENYQKIPI
jgi:hypothetical protein